MSYKRHQFLLCYSSSNDLDDRHTLAHSLPERSKPLLQGSCLEGLKTAGRLLLLLLEEEVVLHIRLQEVAVVVEQPPTLMPEDLRSHLVGVLAEACQLRRKPGIRSRLEVRNLNRMRDRSVVVVVAAVAVRGTDSASLRYEQMDRLRHAA